jgi:hypothetical protein
MNLLAENRHPVETIIAIGIERARLSDETNRIASRLGVVGYLFIAYQVSQYCRPGITSPRSWREV